MDAIPSGSKAHVPECVNQTAFVIALSDSTGRHSLELIGRKCQSNIKIPGGEVSPTTDDQPGFIALKVPILEHTLFRGTTEKSWATHKIGGHITLFGLSYASSEFMEKHCPEGFHAQFVGGDIPFQVTTQGSLFATDIVHGYVVEGSPQIRKIEWIIVYGSDEQIPESEDEIKKRAIENFASRVFNLPKPTEEEWDFSSFLASLHAPVDKNVLLLGSYKATERFQLAEVAIIELGYTPFLLKDSPDLPIQKNLEKLFAAVMFSSFVVILDDEASGHLAEFATLLQFGFRPIVVLRNSDKPATSFLEDSVLTNVNCRVEVLPNLNASDLLPAVKWARAWLARQTSNLNSINAWRNL